jgi:hypothetical protein
MQMDVHSDTCSNVPVEGLLWVIGDISTADGVETLYITTGVVLIAIPRDLQLEIRGFSRYLCMPPERHATKQGKRVMSNYVRSRIGKCLPRRSRANAQYVYAAQCDSNCSSTYITMNLPDDGGPRWISKHAHVRRAASTLRTQSQAIIQLSKRVVAQLLRFSSLPSPTDFEKDEVSNSRGRLLCRSSLSASPRNRLAK